MAGTDFLEVEVLGDRALLRNLDQMPAVVRAILLEKTRGWTDRLYNEVLDNIATRLKQKTGKLEQAVKMEMREADGHIIARVWVDGQEAPYAAAQEKGAIIPAHIIRPREAKVLAFYAASGDKVFATRVFHPGATIPPTWYMADARRAVAPDITRGVKKAVVDGIKQNMRARA